MESVIVISGGTGGIGYGLLRSLASPSARIYFTYHSQSARAAEIESEFPGCFVRGVACDCADFSSVRSFVDLVLEAEERIDTLINAFGITEDRPLVLMAEDEWHKVIDTNLNGIFNFCRCVVFSMLKQKSGTILNISSVTGIHGMAGQTNYAASKAGIIGFSKSLAKEVAPKNVRVNVLAPGFIETAMTDKLTEEYRERMRTLVPLQRLGTIEDLVGLTKLLISEESSYITGQVFTVDGGLYI